MYCVQAHRLTLTSKQFATFTTCIHNNNIKKGLKD